MLNHIWELSVNLAETILFYFYIKSVLYSHTGKKAKKFCYLFFLFIGITLLNYLKVYSLFTVLFALIGHIIYSVFFFENKLPEKIFYGSLFSVICIVSEFIPFLVLMSFSNKDASVLLVNGSLRMISTSIYLFLIIIFILIIRFLFGRETFWSPKDKLIYLFICLAGVTMSHFILLSTVQTKQEDTNHLVFKLAIINVTFLVLFLSLVIYIYELSVSKSRVHTLLEQQKQYELEEQQYYSLLSSTESLRNIKHDMEIHLQNIQKLASDNKIASLNEYVAKYISTISTAHSFISSGNVAIDCVLSTKLSEATSLGIATEYSILLPEHFEMDMIVLSSLLGNLWNNAIEACQRMMHSETADSVFINFYIKPFQDMTIIHIENSFDGIVIPSDKYYFDTRKTDKEHGFGLKRINEIVDNEDGMVQICTDNNLFSVHIMLPLKETSYENNDT